MARKNRQLFLLAASSVFVTTVCASEFTLPDEVVLPDEPQSVSGDRPSGGVGGTVATTTIDRYQAMVERDKCVDGEVQKSVPLYLVKLLSRYSSGSDLRINQVKSGSPALPTGTVEFSFGPIHKCLADKIGQASISIGKEDKDKSLGVEILFKDSNGMTTLDPLIQGCIDQGALTKKENGEIVPSPDGQYENYKDVKYVMTLADADYDVFWKSYGPFSASKKAAHRPLSELPDGEEPCSFFEFPDRESAKDGPKRIVSTQTILEEQIGQMCKDGGLENLEDALAMAKKHNLQDLEKSIAKTYALTVEKEFENTFKKFKENPDELAKFINKKGVSPLYDLVDKYEKYVILPQVEELNRLYAKWDKLRTNKSTDTKQILQLQDDMAKIQRNLDRIFQNTVTTGLISFLEDQGEWSLAKGVHNLYSYKSYLKLAKRSVETKKIYSSTSVKSEMESLRQAYDDALDEKQVEWRIAHGLESAPSPEAVKEKYEKKLTLEYNRFKSAHCSATEKAEQECSTPQLPTSQPQPKPGCPMCQLGFTKAQCTESSRSLSAFPPECTQCISAGGVTSECKGYMSDFEGFPKAYEATKKKILEQGNEEIARAEKLAALEKKYEKENPDHVVSVDDGPATDDVARGDYSSSVSGSSSSHSSSSSSSSTGLSFNPSMFGGSSMYGSSMYGQQPSMYGSSMYGQQPSMYGSSMYGQQPSMYGSSMYGQQPSMYGSSMFGQPSMYGSSMYGQPSMYGSSMFGQPSMYGSSMFGQPSMYGSSMFGQPSMYGGSSYGGSSNPFGFANGMGSTSTYGAPTSYGTSTTGASPFGW